MTLTMEDKWEETLPSPPQSGCRASGPELASQRLRAQDLLLSGWREGRGQVSPPAAAGSSSGGGGQPRGLAVAGPRRDGAGSCAPLRHPVQPRIHLVPVPLRSLIFSLPIILPPTRNPSARQLFCSSVLLYNKET